MFAAACFVTACFSANSSLLPWYIPDNTPAPTDPSSIEQNPDAIPGKSCLIADTNVCDISRLSIQYMLLNLTYSFVYLIADVARLSDFIPGSWKTLSRTPSLTPSYIPDINADVTRAVPKMHIPGPVKVVICLIAHNV